jgi:hypothetical protein
MTLLCTPISFVFTRAKCVGVVRVVRIGMLGAQINGWVFVYGIGRAVHRWPVA